MGYPAPMRALVLALASACAGADPCGADAPPTLALGTGETAFAPIAAPLEVVHGPQGGWHVVVALRAQGLDGSLPWDVTLDGFVEGELAGATAPYGRPRCNRAEATWDVPGLLLVWDAPAESLDGADATLVATATDSQGRTVEASLDVRLEDPTLP